MENIKIFLESTTIHGLTYISSTKHFVKLFWIFVVTSGFTGAAYLINQSFQSWKDSPISTTIETRPITEITFPKVTVCPPKHSNTDLNHDLMMAENMTLSNETRNELIHNSLEFLHDHFFNTVMMNLTKLEDKDRYYNWYHGYAQVAFPSYSRWDDLRYYLNTHAVSGTISTKFFGEEFDAAKVERNLKFRIAIFPPSNAEGNPNVTLHIEIEKISMQYDKFQVEKSFFDEEKRYIVKNYTSPQGAQLQLTRKVSLADVNKHYKQRLDWMPGFKVKWYYSGIKVIPENFYGKERNSWKVYSKAFVRNRSINIKYFIRAD